MISMSKTTHFVPIHSGLYANL